jgi:hypothetical protein
LPAAQQVPEGLAATAKCCLLTANEINLTRFHVPNEELFHSFGGFT